MNHINSTPLIVSPKKSKVYHIENSSKRKASRLQEKFKARKVLFATVSTGDRQVKKRVA